MQVQSNLAWGKDLAVKTELVKIILIVTTWQGWNQSVQLKSFMSDIPILFNLHSPHNILLMMIHQRQVLR
jgi:hypothetical protein